MIKGNQLAFPSFLITFQTLTMCEPDCATDTQGRTLNETFPARFSLLNSQFKPQFITIQAGKDALK